MRVPMMLTLPSLARWAGAAVASLTLALAPCGYAGVASPVSGTVVPANSVVLVYCDDVLADTVTPDDDGSWSSSVTPSAAGTSTVRATAAGQTASDDLLVLEASVVLNGRLGVTPRIDGADKYVVEWADQERSVALDENQPTAILQPLWDEANGAIKGDGAGDTLPTTLAPSNYRYLHNGTGCTLGAVITPRNAASGVTTYILASSIPGASAGIRILFLAPGSVRAVVHDAAGAAVSSVIASVVTDDKRLLILFRYGPSGLQFDWEDEDGNTSSGSDVLGSPSDVDSDLFTIFATPAGGSPAEVDFHQLRTAPAVLTDTDLAAFKAELKAAAGGFAA